tara:strand:- start:6343 stop:8034 length:1692 start_codon:yes stop_codon:yes gene_type:complete
MMPNSDLSSTPSIWQLFSYAATAVPERPAIIWGTNSVSFGEIANHARRFSAWLGRRGLCRHLPRNKVAAHASGQDHVAILMRNRPEYVEVVLGAFAASTVPVNVNYRYVEEELVEILRDSGAKALVYEACFRVEVASIRGRLPDLLYLIEVGGDSEPQAAGTTAYETIISDMQLEIAFKDRSKPDDLCIIYTGGTTGAPKAVLWSQAELCQSMTAGINPATGKRIAHLGELGKGIENVNYRVAVLPPMMHLAGLSMAITALPAGATLLFPAGDSFDARAVWEIVEHERAHVVLSIGNAMGRPLLDELRRQSYDISSVRGIINGAAPMSTDVREGLLGELESKAYIFDSIGSSESGKQAQVVHRNQSQCGEASATGKRGNLFGALPQTRVLAEDLSRTLSEDEHEIGWLASTGHLPFGYLGDPEKSVLTFPVIDGVRYAVPGDRARYGGGGDIEVLGRDAVTINSGGEKIFAEEVEAALLSNSDIVDAIVVGRPSDRWGAEVVAIVQSRGKLSAKAIRSLCEGRLARYKWPKYVIFVDCVIRGPNGKADYRWASRLAMDEVNVT